jgi:hypothetical protein
MVITPLLFRPEDFWTREVNFFTDLVEVISTNSDTERFRVPGV